MVGAMHRRTTPVPVEPWHPARPGLERALRVDPGGRMGPTRGEAEGRYWRAVGPGWFRPATPPATVEQRIVEASYRLPPYGGVTGWAALRWLGGRWFSGIGPEGLLLDVPLAVHTANRVHRPGIELSKERIRPDELDELDGLRVTLPVRSVLFEVRRAPTLEKAVEVLDMACFNDLVSLDEIAAGIVGLRSWTGVQRCRDALPLADENACSPAEVRLRMIWTRVVGRGAIVTNRPVFDRAGRQLATIDVLDVAAGVAGEWQGEHHFERDQRRRDLQREQLLREHGLEYVEFVAGEPHDRTVARIQGAYARAARVPASARAWTDVLPDGWASTFTVADRRKLSDRERVRLLRHRSIDRAA